MVPGHPRTRPSFSLVSAPGHLARLAVMLKVLAWVRSLFLAFILGYALIFVAPRQFGSMTHTLDEQYARCVDVNGYLSKALGLAIAWIALETAIGWSLAVRAGRKKALAAAQAVPPAPAP